MIERNNVLTASRMTSLLSCPRKHYWNCEIGLKKKEQALALRFGSAWAKATEARWTGSPYEDALAYAIPEDVELDAFECAKLAALLRAYYEHYETSEPVGSIYAEVKFERGFILGFTISGKMDGLGSLKDGRSVIIEGKTTAQSIDSDSGYWQRLNFNIQLLNYLTESRHLGWEIAVIFYDVVKKPGLKPLKSVNDLDKDGLKIVVDSKGKRQKDKKGEWAQSANTKLGWRVKTHRETSDEYYLRLYQDIIARPEFYFARREVPVLDSVLEDFEIQREQLARQIDFYRKQETRLAMNHIGKPEQAWPRNVTDDTCNFCQFKSFCLQNLSINKKHLPEGFVIGVFNPELQDEKIYEQSTADET